MKSIIKKIIRNSLISIIAVVIIFSASGTAFGAGNPNQNNPLPSYTPLVPLPCIPSPATVDGNGNTVPAVTCGTDFENNVNFKTYIQYIINVAIAIAAVMAVFMITLGGFQYMTSDAWTEKSAGLERVRHAILGLLLILSSYLLLRTIDPRLVQIPTSLVPALDIQYNYNALNELQSWQNQLAQEISKFNADQEKLRNQISQASAQLQQMSQDQASLEEQIKTYYPYQDVSTTCYSDNTAIPELDTLCQQWLQNQDAQINLKDNTSLSQAEGVMDTILNKCGTTGSTGNSSITTPTLTQSNCYQDHFSEFASAYDSYKSLLGPENQAKLLDYKNYSEAVFTLDEVQSAVYNYKNFGGTFAVPYTGPVSQYLANNNITLQSCSQPGMVLVNNDTYSINCRQQYISAVVSYYSSVIKDQTYVSKIKIKAATAGS